ncbi:MAG: hypothetical protein LUH04_05505 [Clostridium sp.]|nr:hypothetical protein [Clostridium sp.]
MKTMKQAVRPKEADGERPGIRGFVALILFIMVFSGALKDVPVLKALDFNNMMGAFGIVKGAEGNFQGVGGVGAKDGFMVAFAQLPLLMLAMGIVELATQYRALLAAKVLFTPILRPLLGIPGAAGLTLVSSLNSSDGGAVMTADLYNRGYLTQDERTIFVGFQFAASGMIVATVTLLAMAPMLVVSPMFIMGILLLMKFVNGNITRLVVKKHPSADEGIREKKAE